MAMSKLGFSFSTKSQAAFSAKVLKGYLDQSNFIAFMDAGRAYLAGSVNIRMIHSLLPGNWVPFFLAVDLRVPLRVHDGSK